LLRHDGRADGKGRQRGEFQGSVAPTTAVADAGVLIFSKLQTRRVLDRM
jgi:hypothetical protein